MFEILGTVISGVLSGGATGLIGLGINLLSEASKRKHDLETMRLQNELTRELKKADDEQQIRLAQMTAESQKALADVAFEQRIGELASGDYQASMTNDRASYVDADGRKNLFVQILLGFVDFCRGITRPGVTWASMWLLGAMLYWVYNLHRSSQLTLSPGETYSLAKEIVETATFIVTTTTVWWFGSRPAPKR